MGQRYLKGSLAQSWYIVSKLMGGGHGHLTIISMGEGLAQKTAKLSVS